MSEQEFKEAVGDLKEFYGNEVKRLREVFDIRSTIKLYSGFALGIIFILIIEIATIVIYSNVIK